MLPNADVLIAGAGPSGLMLALELCRHGARPRIVDPLPGPSPLSRALVVHARTLELLDRHGLAEEFVKRGEMGRGVALRRAGRVAAMAPLGRIGEGLSPFPFALIISQDQTERLLREALASTYGIEVEWNTALTSLSQGTASISATLQRAGSSAEIAHAFYLAGCDGAHSAVRHALGIGFPGGTYEQQFFVADTLTDGLEVDAEAGRLLEISLAPRTFNAFFPMPQGRTRIIGLLPATLAPEAVTFADVQPTLEAAEHVRVREVSWFSTYRVHHRVADRFRQGRAFLLGDAGHIHSPAGGQGMNTGLGDAINLGWKLAAVLHQHAPEALLDTYEAERIPFARQLVATTDRAFTAATRASAWASFVRTQVVPRLLPLALRLGWVRRLMFRTISQIGIRYPHSPLSGGKVRAVAGGMRLPWSPGPRYAALRQPGWHLLTIGPVPAAGSWAQAHGLPVTEVAPAARETAGTIYLVRPDGYLGLVAATFNEAECALYAQHWGLGK